MRFYQASPTRNPGVIPLEIRDHIFDPGVSSKHGDFHHGLGLPSIKKLAETYGGYTIVSSQPVSGTCVMVGLPKKVQEELT
jgi:signal transduction histidine kinase